MASVRRIFSAVLVCIAVTPSIVACSDDDGGRSTNQTTPVDAASFRAEADAICVRVSDEIDAITAAAATTPADAARSLRAVAEASRVGVDQLRVVTAPTGLEDGFRAWLAIVDDTANKLEAGALALQVGDNTAFQDAVNDAETSGQRAAAAAQGLGLSACVF